MSSFSKISFDCRFFQRTDKSHFKMATSSKTTEFDAIIAGDLTNKTPFASTDLDETSITSTNSSSDSTLSQKYLVMASSSSSTDEAANITSKNSIMKNTRNSNPELQASNGEFVPPDGGCRVRNCQTHFFCILREITKIYIFRPG